MIIEHRTYLLHPEVQPDDYLRPYAELGLPVQRRILGGLVGYFVTEIGPLNQVVHLWAYEDLEDRRRRRAELAADERWQACLAVIRPMIQSMENKILLPTDFSPVGSAYGLPGGDPMVGP